MLADLKKNRADLVELLSYETRRRLRFPIDLAIQHLDEDEFMNLAKNPYERTYLKLLYCTCIYIPMPSKQLEPFGPEAVDRAKTDIIIQSTKGTVLTVLNARLYAQTFEEHRNNLPITHVNHVVFKPECDLRYVYSIVDQVCGRQKEEPVVVDIRGYQISIGEVRFLLSMLDSSCLC